MTILETTIIFWLTYSTVAICVAAYLINFVTSKILTEKKSTYISYVFIFLIVSVPCSLFAILEIL